MRRVVIESPYAGDEKTNRAYLVDCLRDSLRRGEAPFASHGQYTEALDDGVPEDREHGIAAGHAWRRVAEATVVYTDLGVSRGMLAGIQAARTLGQVSEWRSLWPSEGER